MDNPYFEFLLYDITFPLYVEVDEIYNLACPASPVNYQYDPVQTTKTSVHGSINMLLANQLAIIQNLLSDMSLIVNNTVWKSYLFRIMN